MQCFLCKKQTDSYRKLDANGFRIKFMRKAHPSFNDTSLLCLPCFNKFEAVRSATVVSTSTSSSKSFLTVSSKENTQSNVGNAIEFNINSITCSSNDSIDSTDRLVHKATEISSLQDFSRITRHPDIIIAQEASWPAERSALRRKRTREEATPSDTPTGRTVLHVIDDNDEAAIIPLSDLIHVRPVVKKRKEPVVHVNQDVMDIYLAKTSGG